MGRLRNKRLYDREFKLNELKLMEHGGMRMTQVARDPWVNINTLSNWQKYKTKAEAGISLFRYIEGFYNTRRIHSSLGYRSPKEFEMIYKLDKLKGAA